jgi:hypothetical protein
VFDCAGVWDGGAVFEYFYYDFDSDGFGSGSAFLICNAFAPNNMISNNDDSDDNCASNSHDCLGVCDGSSVEDDCGICGGNNSICSDCAGIPNGNSYVDNCGSCDNDSSNDCDADCAGTWGGDAEFDECGVCDGDGAAMDCAGICFGTSVEDECAVCGGNGPAEGYDCDGNCAVEIDCNGECDGSAVVDECDVCGGPGPLECWDGVLVCDVYDCSDEPVECPDGTILKDQFLSYDENICVPEDFSTVNQSTLQAFYYIYTVTINSNSVDGEDWVGVFNGDICVGAQKWDTSLCNNGVCDVPAMGDDNSEWTEGYMQTDDIPSYKIFDTSANTYYDAVASEYIPWQAHHKHRYYTKKYPIFVHQHKYHH